MGGKAGRAGLEGEGERERDREEGGEKGQKEKKNLGSAAIKKSESCSCDCGRIATSSVLKHTQTPTRYGVFLRAARRTDRKKCRWRRCQCRENLGDVGADRRGLLEVAKTAPFLMMMIRAGWPRVFFPPVCKQFRRVCGHRFCGPSKHL